MVLGDWVSDFRYWWRRLGGVELHPGNLHLGAYKID
jgi:hypothetical protein